VTVGIVRQSQCLTVALRSPCTALFSRFWQPRGGCHGGGEEGMASVFRGGQRRMGGGEASLCVWRRDENQEGRIAQSCGLVIGGARSEGGIKKLGTCCYVF